MNFSLKAMAKVAFIAIFTLMAVSRLSAQSPDPAWYTMIKDPEVNFFKAVEAYETYWQGKKIPPMEEYVYEQENKVDYSKMTRQEKEQFERIFMMNRKFVMWRIDAEPWVQPDGHVLTQEERQVIIERQQKELQELERQNGKN